MLKSRCGEFFKYMERLHRMQLDHRHVIINCEGLRNPPSIGDEEKVEDWMRRLVKAVKMNILMEPKAFYCPIVGNEGITAACCIETSHASIHIWEKSDPKILRFDLYSCSHFETNTVLDFIKEFEPHKISFLVLDRNGLDIYTEERGEIILETNVSR